MPLLTHTVIESDSGLVSTAEHIFDAPTCCVIQYTYVEESTNFVDRGVDAPALDAVEYAGGLVSHTTPHDDNIACGYAGLRFEDSKTDCEVTRTIALLKPLPIMKELVQPEKFFYDDIAEVVLL
ncbi:uncharacterized protein PHALS_13670 [Plasmopara halstedii]|uniref:Uncharacterized protein n=1 Tax=Plasmopara halstedii TaxID=4781 RepID=A0A0P1APQ3_PLAHL|nr:uncharacterized protein PHALS_13670 [Plasmopara halstedii]CEG43476.1 hypothetical protein PHALS_13670 [Plasmopara halstedii]|eukprot:XP_024579845.1 hypothetical protein PHALS_13670 [Plasmopara halstedii]